MGLKQLLLGSISVVFVAKPQPLDILDDSISRNKNCDDHDLIKNHKIDEVSSKAFSGWKSCRGDTRILEFTGNGKSLHGPALRFRANFEGLAYRSIRIHENGRLALCSVDMFQSMALQPTTIYLQDNAISWLPPGIFSGLVNVQYLVLNTNKIACLTSTIFQGLVSLRELSLNDNEIKALPDGLFDGLDSLQRVSLTGNKLSTLSPTTFVRVAAFMVSALIIDVTGNPIDRLPFCLVAYPNMAYDRRAKITEIEPQITDCTAHALFDIPNTCLEQPSTLSMECHKNNIDPHVAFPFLPEDVLNDQDTLDLLLQYLQGNESASYYETYLYPTEDVANLNSNEAELEEQGSSDVDVEYFAAHPELRRVIWITTICTGLLTVLCFIGSLTYILGQRRERARQAFNLSTLWRKAKGLVA